MENKVRTYTAALGIFLIVLGVLGFVNGVMFAPHVNDPAMTMISGYGRLFDLFARNALFNVIHLAIGVSAFIASRDNLIARKFCRFSTWIFGVLTLMGVFPTLNTMWGIIPLFGHNIWLNGFITLASAYFGYMHVGQMTTYSSERTSTAA